MGCHCHTSHRHASPVGEDEPATPRSRYMLVTCLRHVRCQGASRAHRNGGTGRLMEGTPFTQTEIAKDSITTLPAKDKIA
jgi:hypothetical protein